MSSSLFDQVFGALVFFFGYMLSSPANILVWTLICPAPLLLYGALTYRGVLTHNTQQRRWFYVGWAVASIITLFLYAFAFMCLMVLGMWG